MYGRNLYSLALPLINLYIFRKRICWSNPELKLCVQQIEMSTFFKSYRKYPCSVNYTNPAAKYISTMVVTKYNGSRGTVISSLCADMLQLWTIFWINQVWFFYLYFVTVSAYLPYTYFCCYFVTIVAIGHGLLKKFWPMVIGCVLRTAGSSLFETMQTRLLR